MALSKANLVADIALQTGKTKTDVTDMIDLIIGNIGSLLRDGETVDIRGFIKLEPVNKPARTGRNPRTGAPIEIAAKTVVKATASKSLLGGA